MVKFKFYEKIFIDVQLIYNIVLVSGVQQSDSVTHTYTFILFQTLFQYRLLGDIPVLYSSSLFIYFIDSNVYMLIPNYLSPSTKMANFAVCNLFIYLPHPQHMEVPGSGTESKMQLWPMPQLQQRWFLNPLCQARNQTHISVVTQATAETTGSLTHCATAGSPLLYVF